MALYPNHKPHGVKSSWEHCSLGQASTSLILKKYGIPEEWGDPVDAVGWFDAYTGSARVIVADYANRKRATLRIGGGRYALTFSRLAAPEPSP